MLTLIWFLFDMDSLVFFRLIVSPKHFYNTRTDMIYLWYEFSCPFFFWLILSLQKKKKEEVSVMSIEKIVSDLSPGNMALKNHIKSHTNEKPYQCVHFQKSFLATEDIA